MSYNDRHLTTEQLSALLDRQISAEELDVQQTHLNTCQQCRLRFADLQQTVALLHALPQPSLPRSFTLPVKDAVVTPISTYADKAQDRPSRRRAQPSYLRTTMRVLSTFAAVLGIIFLLSAVPLTPHANTSSAVPDFAAHSTTSQPPIGGGRPKDQPQVGQGQVPPATATSDASTPHAVSPRTQSTPVPVPPAIPPVTLSPPLIDLNSTWERAILGLTLLLLATLGFFWGKRMRW